MNDGITPVKVRITNKVKNVMEAEYALNDSVQLPTIARRVRDDLMNDAKFLKEAIGMMVYTVAYQSAQRVAAASRMTVSHDEAPDDPKQLTKRSRWDAWLEHIGDRHLKLMDMTIQDLDAAIAEREQRAYTELKTVSFLRSIKARLEGGQTIGERFNGSELTQIWTSIVRGEAA